jgi:hypothetical protein
MVFWHCLLLSMESMGYRPPRPYGSLDTRLLREGAARRLHVVGHVDVNPLLQLLNR